MKVYIASIFADKARTKIRGQELEKEGIIFTSRWVEEKAAGTSTIDDFTDDYFRATAVYDIVDILAADKLILTVPSAEMMTNAPIRSLARGGRHFESGFMYGLIYGERQFPSHFRELILLGKPENVFHFLDGVGVAQAFPAIRHFDTWEELKDVLVEEAKNGK